MENSIAYITQAKISLACTYLRFILKIKIRLRGLFWNTLITVPAYAYMKTTCISGKELGSLEKAH